MKTATVTDFRQNMKEHLSEIRNDQDILILTGPRKMEFVVLTLEAYNSMEETAHLLSTPANTERLMESIAQDKAGNMLVKELEAGDDGGARRATSSTKLAKHRPLKRGR